MNSIKQNTLEQYEDLLNGGGATYDRIASLLTIGKATNLRAL